MPPFEKVGQSMAISNPAPQARESLINRLLTTAAVASAGGIIGRKFPFTGVASYEAPLIFQR
jgi:hypothetical protein